MLPSSRALWLAAALALLGLIAAMAAGIGVDVDWRQLWLIALAALAGFMLIDLLLGLSSRPPRVRLRGHSGRLRCRNPGS